jgi:hypothetical protein
LGENPGQFRLDHGRPIKGSDKGAPLFCGGGESAIVGENVFRLEAGACDNKIGNGGTLELRPGANECLLTIRNP